MQYINLRGENYDQKVSSKILTDSAPYLSNFVAKLFHIEREHQELLAEIKQDDPIWKYKFFVQRRAIKKFNAEAVNDLNYNELDWALKELRNTSFDDTLR